MFLVHLVRHAESTANIATIIGGVDATLTDRGMKQAEHLGAYWKRALQVDAIYTSHYHRAARTASIVVDAIDYQGEVVLDSRLIEIVRGEWDGREISEVITADVRAEMGRLGLDYRTPGGESLREVGKRMHEWLLDARERHAKAIVQPDEWHPHAVTTVTASIAAFTHGHAIRGLLLRLFNFDIDVRAIRLDNTSITTLRWNGKMWGIDCLNTLPHLVG